MPVYGYPSEYGLNFRVFGVHATENHVYVMDNANDKVDVYTHAGELVSSFGETGTGQGEFLSPISIAGNSENFFIGDNRRNDVQVGVLFGETIPANPFVGTALAPNIYRAQVSGDGVPTWSWVSGGNGTGTFQRKLDDGEWVTTTNLSYSFSEILDDGTYTLYVREQSYNGLWGPYSSLAVNVVSDGAAVPPATAPVISGETPTTDSTPTWTWISGGGGVGSFRYKLGLNADWTVTEDTSYTAPAPLPNGEYTLYVQEANSQGTWSTSATYAITVDRVYTTGEYIQPVASLGETDGKFLFPVAIASTSTELFVADNEKQDIQVFNYAGEYLRKINISSSNTMGLAVYVNVDPIVVVADSVLDNIRYFNTVSGTLLNTISSIKSHGLAYYNNELYAVDLNTKNIKVYVGTTLQRQFGVAGTGVGQFASPEYISVANGVVYVTDAYRKKVLTFSTAGVFAAEWGV